MWVDVAVGGAFRHYYGFDRTCGNTTDSIRADTESIEIFVDQMFFGVVESSKDSAVTANAVVNLRGELISAALSIGQR